MQDAVLGQGEGEHEPVALAILGNVADAGVRGLPGRRTRDVDAMRSMGPRRRGAHAGERLDELALPIAVDAGDRDDLARAQVHGEAAHGVQAAVVAHPEVAHREHVLAGVRVAARDVEQHLAADHQLGQAALAGACAVDGGDLLAAPQDGDAVGDFEYLVQLVRDQDDEVPPARARAARRRVVDLVGRQHRGRLVEDQHAGVAVERLEDLDALLLPDGDRRERVRVTARPTRVSSRRAAGRVEVERPRRCGSAPSRMFSTTGIARPA